MSLPRFFQKHSLLALPVFWVAIGCQSQPKGPPPNLAVPAILTSVSHYTGTPLSGPRAAVATIGSADSTPSATVQWVAVQTIPTEMRQSLASQCRLIIAGQTGAPMLASPELTKGVLFDQSADVSALQSRFAGPPSPQFAPISTLSGALPDKVTSSLLAATSSNAIPRTQIVLRIAPSEISTTMPTTASVNRPIEMTLEISQDSSTTTQPSTPKIETAVFDRSLTNGRDHLAILIPIKFSDSPAQALLALIEIKPTSTADLLTQCHTDLESSAAIAAKKPSVAAVEGSAWAGYDSALAALWQPSDRRAALVFLSAQTSAHICEDTALVANDSILEKLANTIAERAALPSQAHTATALAWLLDRAAFELLVLSDAPAKGTPAVPLPSELKAVLTVYAGEPARHGGSMDDMVQQATSRQDLENRLTADNLVFLTDPSPASRVRAFDWLKARGLAPAGFDPLGPAKQRREALDKSLSAAAN